MIRQPTGSTFRSARIGARLAAAALLLQATSAALADARADYASLFGEEEKKVLATGFTRDDATFAAKLLSRAADLKDAPELQRLVLERAVDIGQKDADGLATSIEAAKQIIAMSSGASKQDWRGKLVDLYAAQYKRATGARRAEAGEFLLGVLQKEADDLLAETRYADAVKRLNEGRDIARSIRSPRVDDFLAAAKEVQAKQVTADKYDRLRQKLEQQGGETALLEQVILGYLLEVGDPEKAKKLASGHPDKAWEKMVELSAKPLADLVNPDLIMLGDWYMAVGDQLPGCPDGFGRAQSYYRTFLRNHQKKDAEALKVQQSLDHANRQLSQVAPGSVTADRLILWNQHNAQWNDRGTLAVNVLLLRKGKNIWRQGNLSIPWAPNADTKVEVEVPPVVFDKVRIDIIRWQGRGGGLAEIQVFAGTVNLAAGAKVSASEYLIAPPGIPRDVHAADKLTDGVTSSGNYPNGYWLSGENRSGWAEVEVRPQ